MRKLYEGEYGPGTNVAAHTSNKNWKGSIGAIENKNRPESIYITMSSWVKPKLSVISAQQHAEENPEDLVDKVVADFVKELDRTSRKVSSMFDSAMFDTSSVIFTYDFADEGVKPGKRSFLEIEINIDTVNEIDWEGNPTPSKHNGKVNNIPFKDFVKPAEHAIAKILNMDVFAKSNLEFAVTKGS